MFKKFRIVHRLTLAFLSLGLLVLIVVSVVFYFQFKEALIDRTIEQLSSVNMLKKTGVENTLQQKLLSVEKLSKSGKKEWWLDLPSELGMHYLPSNMLYVDCQEAIPPAIFNQHYKHITFIDLSHELKSKNLLLALVVPTKEGNLFYMQYPAEIQELLHERTGLGLTGESYLVGSDYKMRSSSRFFPDTDPLSIEVKSEGVLNAFDKNEGQGIIKDYRGENVLSVYRKLNWGTIHWVILSEIDEQEALLPVNIMRNRLMVISAIFLLIIIAVSVYISRRIAIPIRAIENVVLELAEGKFPKEIPEPGGDEIGKMAEAIEKLVSGLKKSIVFADKIGQGDFTSEHQLLSDEDALGKALEHMKKRLNDLVKRNDELALQSKFALVQGQEDERARLSKDIHDGVGPILTSIKLNLAQLPLSDGEKNNLKDLIDEAITELRRVSYNLMPPVLLDFGAGAAIKNLIETVSKSTSCKIFFIDDSKKESSKLNNEINVTLYRIAQESLNNALKYAKANEIKVSLTEFEDHVSFYISDNGEGIHYKESKSDFSGKGLINIKERVALLNGDFYLTSEGRGTTIEVEIPLWKK